MQEKTSVALESVIDFLNADDSDDSVAAELRDVLRLQIQGEQPKGAERLLERVPLRLDLSDNAPAVVPAGSRENEPARIVATIASLPVDQWRRLKICPAEDCEWVFYDASRNRSRRWCSMQTCGNRAKVNAYRRREHPD